MWHAPVAEALDVPDVAELEEVEDADEDGPGPGTSIAI